MNSIKNSIQPIIQPTGLWPLMKQYSDEDIMRLVKDVVGNAETFEGIKSQVSSSPFADMVQLLPDASQRALFNIYLQYK